MNALFLLLKNSWKNKQAILLTTISLRYMENALYAKRKIPLNHKESENIFIKTTKAGLYTESRFGC